MEPRFYSKYTVAENPEVYNISIALAAEASSSAPNYFLPKKHINGNGVEELLVDGGIIANNPSMFAFILAAEVY